MIGTGMKQLKGSITPKLSDKMHREFHRIWESQVGTTRAPVPHVPTPTLKTDGETFEIEYEIWDEGSLKHTLEIAVGKAVNLVDLKSPPRKVTYNP
jgi:hypothetical protein